MAQIRCKHAPSAVRFHRPPVELRCRGICKEITIDREILASGASQIETCCLQGGDMLVDCHNALELMTNLNLQVNFLTWPVSVWRPSARGTGEVDIGVRSARPFSTDHGCAGHDNRRPVPIGRRFSGLSVHSVALFQLDLHQGFGLCPVAAHRAFGNVEQVADFLL